MKSFCTILLLCSSFVLQAQVKEHKSSGFLFDIENYIIKKSFFNYQDTVSLLFVGDVMQHTNQLRAAKVNGSFDYVECFKHVRPQIEKADIAICNFETTLSGKPYRGYPSFRSPDELAVALKTVGFDLFLTANNHVLDGGKKGVERTVSKLDELNIKHIGSYKNSQEKRTNDPIFFSSKGMTIAFLNYTYGTNGLKSRKPNVINYIDTTVIKQDLALAKLKKPDLIIACMHWGIEYKSLPNSNQKRLAKWLIKNGVNHVIGGHPHVIQPLELVSANQTDQKHLIAYSLGNFISNMKYINTKGGMMLTLDFVKESGAVKLVDVDYTLVFTGNDQQTEEKNYILFPSSMKKEDIPKAVNNQMVRFESSANRLLKVHSKGIFFEKNQKNDGNNLVIQKYHVSLHRI